MSRATGLAWATQVAVQLNILQYFRYFKSKLLQLHIYIFVDSPGAGDPAPSRRWHISASETATSHGTGLRLRFIEYMYVFLLFFLFGTIWRFQPDFQALSIFFKSSNS